MKNLRVAPHDGCVDWNGTNMQDIQNAYRRTPRWVRGLKYSVSIRDRSVSLSHPTMGAWIEIVSHTTGFVISASHPTMGAWIEIILYCSSVTISSCRTPRWVRGLKYSIRQGWKHRWQVAPHDGCVDWNNSLFTFKNQIYGRTPRWVRGLK